MDICRPVQDTLRFPIRTVRYHLQPLLQNRENLGMIQKIFILPFFQKPDDPSTRTEGNPV